MDGIEFTKRIELVLSEMGITKSEFAVELGLSHSTLSAWKTNNYIPPVSTVNQIAEKLEVSIEWLLHGETLYSEEIEDLVTPRSRKVVRKRIYQLIYDAFGKNVEPYKATDLSCEQDLQKLHNGFFGKEVISYWQLKNWAKFRCNIDNYVFDKIACMLKVDISYLLFEYTGKTPDPIDLKFYERALAYRNEIYCLDNYSPERQQLAKKLLNELMYLEDYEYKDKNKQKK